MSRINKALAQKVYEKWIPKIENRLKESGVDPQNVSEARKKVVATMAHTRKVYESAQATLQNVPGKAPYSLGNNPDVDGNAGFHNPSKRGSAEVFQNLFGLFVDVASTNVGMELLPTLPMTRSSGTIYIAEPIYANGRLESAENKPIIFQVKAIKNGTAPALVIGTTYTIKTANSGGENIMDVAFMGFNRLNGNFVFRTGTQYDNSGSAGTNWKEEIIKDCVDSATTGAGIYTTANNYWSFNADFVDYLAGFTNFTAGMSGAGPDDDQPWFMNRGDGTRYGEPMSRETGQRTFYRSMAIRTWSRNFNARTVHIDIEYTTEQMQDMMADLETNALEFGESILKDQLDQHINEHIIGRIFALGWEHHANLNQQNGFNLNAFIASSASTGASKTFRGMTANRTISGPSGVLPSTGAIAENLNSLQRRVITRMLYASGIINNRGRRGRGDQSLTNTKLMTAIRDIRGYQAAPFTNDINDAGLYFVGSLYGMRLYEDPLMELWDDRISVSRKGDEKSPGLKFCPFLLGEKISYIAPGTAAPKEALKSRYELVDAGTYPETMYLTFTVDTEAGYAIV